MTKVQIRFKLLKPLTDVLLARMTDTAFRNFAAAPRPPSDPSAKAF